MIKVIVKEPYKDPEIKTVESSLKTWQEIVGGYIETIPFPGIKGAVIILNEEGKLDALDGNFWVPHYDDFIVGSVAIVGSGDDDFESLSDNQIKGILKHIEKFKLEPNQNIYSDYKDLKELMSERLKKFNNQEMA